MLGGMRNSDAMFVSIRTWLWGCFSRWVLCPAVYSLSQVCSRRSNSSSSASCSRCSKLLPQNYLPVCECDPTSWKNLDHNWLTRSRVFYPFNGDDLLVRSALSIGLHTTASGASSANRPTADRGLSITNSMVPWCRHLLLCLIGWCTK